MGLMKGLVGAFLLALFVGVDGSHITQHVEAADPTCALDTLGRISSINVHYWDWTFDEFNKPLEVVDKLNRLNINLELTYYHYTGPGVSFWEAWEGCNDLGRPFNNETKLPMQSWVPLYELAKIESAAEEDCVFLHQKNNPLKYLRRPDYPTWLSGIRDENSPNKFKWVSILGDRDYFFDREAFLYRNPKSEWTDIAQANMTVGNDITRDGGYYNWYLDEPRSYHAGPDTVTDHEGTVHDVDFTVPVLKHQEFHHRDCLAVTNSIRKEQGFKWLGVDCYSKFKYVCKPRADKIQAYIDSYYSATGVFANEPHFSAANAPEYSKDFLKHFACEGLKGASQLTVTYHDLDANGIPATSSSTITSKTGSQPADFAENPTWVDSDLSWVGIQCDTGDRRK